MPEMEVSGVAPPCTPGRQWIGGVLGCNLRNVYRGSVALGAWGSSRSPSDTCNRSLRSTACHSLWEFGCFSVRPAAQSALLWPALYALHAILILAGSPHSFRRPLAVDEHVNSNCSAMAYSRG